MDTQTNPWPSAVRIIPHGPSGPMWEFLPPCARGLSCWRIIVGRDLWTAYRQMTRTLPPVPLAAKSQPIADSACGHSQTGRSSRIWVSYFPEYQGHPKELVEGTVGPWPQSFSVNSSEVEPGNVHFQQMQIRLLLLALGSRLESLCCRLGVSWVAQVTKNPLPMQETWDAGCFPGSGRSLEEGMAPTPVFLPGESHWKKSLVGYDPWYRQELDTTEATEQAPTLQAGVRRRGGPLASGWWSFIRWWALVLLDGRSRTSLGCLQNKGHKMRALWGLDIWNLQKWHLTNDLGKSFLC